MSLRNHRNLVIVVGVVVALLAATVLLGGYANIVPAGSDADSQAKGCPAAAGKACCPMSGGSAVCPKVSADQQAQTGSAGTPCVAGCPKPCCAEQAEGCCPTPCPIPCPKPCCVVEAGEGCCGTSGPAACCAGLAETANQ